MSYFPDVSRWHLSTSAFAESLSEMARDGSCGNEGVALWLGRRADGTAHITQVVALRGPGVIKRPRFLRIDSCLLNEVADLARERGLCLVGQIHSHGGRWTDLSETDRTYGICVPGYLSIVAPGFALESDLSIADCGIHVYEPPHGYRRLPLPEVRDRVQVVSDDYARLVVVGSGE